jgi:hypothetical protein
MSRYQVEKDWTTEAGLRAVVIMGSMGHRCGYVGVPVGHPLHGVTYHDNTPALDPPAEDEPVGNRGVLSVLCASERMQSPEIAFDVHGSLTYSGGNGDYPVASDLWWFGYDCGHAGDARDPDSEIGQRYPAWEGVFRSLDYCVGECESLARQIVAKTRVLA